MSYIFKIIFALFKFSLSFESTGLFLNENKIVRNLQKCNLLYILRYTLSHIFDNNLKHTPSVMIWKKETFTDYQ